MKNNATSFEFPSTFPADLVDTYLINNNGEPSVECTGEKRCVYFTEKKDITPLIHHRERFAYKNTFGHALIVAGSRGKMGAAVLCAKACLRSGAGLVTAHIPACGEIIVQSALPEAMVKMDTANDCISDAGNIESFQALGIGPGIGMQEMTSRAMEKIRMQSKNPLVLDADALNLLSQHKDRLKRLPSHSILTPHAGEFDRLAGKSQSPAGRLEKARNLAAEIHCILVLKGAYTAVCLPNGEIHFNSTGNPGMATAGSGDVLTGIITGLLAQSYTPAEAAILGVYLHGLAGDMAIASTQSQESMIAGDIIENLGEAYKYVKS
jgi:NAD(P)H-hydrate epimerase